MKIVNFSVKNYQFTIVVFLLALALGLNSFLNMPRGEDPVVHAPNFPIVAVYPGTSPEDMEKLIVKPIEDKINELNDVKRIKTEINDGVSVTTVEFDYGVNVDDKHNEVVREINSLRGILPSNLQSLEVEQIDPSDVNTYQIALLSNTATYKQLYDSADELKKQIEKVGAVKKVEILAYPAQQIKVNVDLEKIANNHIALDAIMNTIQGEAENIPAGSVDAGDKKYNVKTSGDYKDLEEIRNTVIKTSGESIVYLKDVADVTMSYEDETYIARYNGKRAIFIAVSEKKETNIIKNNENIAPIIEKFSHKLPANIKLENTFIQAEDVGHRLNHFFRDFGIAILLVIFTLTPLGLRAATVVMISIPLSIAIGLFLLDSMGYTINQLTIVGLVVALGLLVDDSIVVIENIERYLRNGHSPYRAAIDATHQIGVAIIGCTAILIVSFLPIVFLPEVSGDFIRSMPMAVITTVLASLLVSLTVVPFLASLILKRHSHEEGNIVLRKLQKGINKVYKPVLHQALARPYLTIGIAVALFIGSIALTNVVGFSLFPRSEKPMFLVNIETPLGTNLYKTNEIARYVEKTIMQDKRAKAVYTNVGQGNPRIYYNVNPHKDAANYAQIFIRLHEMDIEELEGIIEKFRAKFENYSGAKIEVKQFEQGPPIEAPIAIRVFGDNLDTLRSLAAKVETEIKNTEGVIYPNNLLQTYKTDIKVNINKDRAALIGLPSSTIDQTIRMGISGLNVADYKDEKGDNYKINVSVSRDRHPKPEIFQKLYITSQNGNLIPIQQVADLKYETSVPLIKHYDKNRYALITSDVKNGYNTQETTQKILEKINKIQFPEGYSYVAAGELESSQESFGGLGTIILITVFGFMGILLLEFRTFKSSLIVLSVIPLGIVGAVVILFLTGNTLSFMASIGIIALAGIEVKNSILLVDFTNQLREEGMDIDQAIEVAGETRFLPIILTSMTAILGLVPLVLENSPFYSPLAWVIIGGLISSTVLTRLVTPVVYKLIAPSIAVKSSEETVPVTNHPPAK
ncbi:multidrug efflux pump subunit AcrB [Flavobacterium endophyticum]|uniref:Multidrug efflux pump subunit AcrB n=1 Tax=Flavobacterium endophyticum TaxID=1540163 RepID=A0A495M146_9FLAO|nr:efflux RND transporter permease subunit [Flavobacterium endophyticum]RKS19042.1 multidrug efflux pump subunit AcrB [Flavobacterium endophyticum]